MGTPLLYSSSLLLFFTPPSSLLFLTLLLPTLAITFSLIFLSNILPFSLHFSFINSSHVTTLIPFFFAAPSHSHSKSGLLPLLSVPLLLSALLIVFLDPISAFLFLTNSPVSAGPLPFSSSCCCFSPSSSA